MDTVEVVYEVEIKGDTPPFKWKLWRSIDGGAKSIPKIKDYRIVKDGGGTKLEEAQIDAEGAASTYEDALRDAQLVAEEIEAQYVWERTKVSEVVLTAQRYKSPQVKEQEK